MEAFRTTLSTNILDKVRKIEIRISHHARELSQKYGLLPYMVQRFLWMLGEEETTRFLESIEKGLPKSIRCNTLSLGNCNRLPELLEKRGVIVFP